MRLYDRHEASLGIRGFNKLVETEFIEATSCRDLFRQWTRRFPTHCHAKFHEAYEAVERYGLAERDYNIKAFVKIERLPSIVVECIFDEAKPRLIQGRSDKVKVATGPYFWAMGKALAAWWHVGHRITYASGLTAEALGEWAQGCETDGLVPLCFDMSGWDGTVGPGPLEAWRRFCNSNHAPPAVSAFLARRKKPTKGVTRFGWQYSKLAQVSSGDGDTSVGNSFVHGLGWLDLLDRTLGPTGGRVLVLGDDSVVAVPPQLAGAIQAAAAAHWHDLGFIVKSVSGGWGHPSFTVKKLECLKQAYAVEYISME